MATESSDVEHWKRRGRNDALAGKGALFRNIRGHIVATADGTDDWSDDDLRERGEAYLEGYNEVG